MKVRGKLFSIDIKSREPIYTQLEKNIVRYINLGVYEKDSMLPSVRALATELGINPNTVSKAYKKMEADGVIYTIAGKGVFVKGDSSLVNVQKQIAENIKTTLTDAKNAGLEKESVLKIVNEVWEAKEID